MRLSGAGNISTTAAGSSVVNSNGTITASQRPYFFYNTLDTTTFTSAGNRVPRWTVPVTASADYSTSTGRFTASIAGVYAFSWCYLMQSIDTGTTIDDGWSFNGNFYYGGERHVASNPYTWGDSYYAVKQTVIIRLNVGDYFNPQSNHGDINWAFYGGGNWGHISGCLIG